jgi:hypothetical protein
VAGPLWYYLQSELVLQIALGDAGNFRTEPGYFDIRIPPAGWNRSGFVNKYG